MSQTNLKHVAGLFLSVVAFTLSVVLVNALSVKETLPVAVDDVFIEQPRVSSNQFQMRREMWQFLEEDRQHGIELSRDTTKNSGENLLTDETIATAILVEKMHRANYEKFPTDFQTAWENHLSAWRERADFLRRASRNKNNKFINQNLSSEHSRQSLKIHETYMILLESAKRHGVKFSY